MTLPVRALGGRRREHSFQERKRLSRAVLGEQHPGQHEILRLVRVRWLVACAEAAILGPAGRSGDVALGQQQPRPLRGDGVEQAGHPLAQCGPSGLAHGLQCPARITLGLPDPRQGHQARAQRRGIEELPA